MNNQKDKLKIYNLVVFVNVAALIGYQCYAAPIYSKTLDESYSIAQIDAAFWSYVLPMVVLFLPIVFFGWKIFAAAKVTADHKGVSMRDLSFREWHGI